MSVGGPAGIPRGPAASPGGLPRAPAPCRTPPDFLTGVVCSLLLVPVAVSALHADALEDGLRRLRSTDPFERHRGEAEVLRLGTPALPSLAREIEQTGGSARAYRFRAEKLFSDLLEGFLSEIESEHQAMVLDQNELKGLNERKDAAGQRKTLSAKLEEWRKKDPEIQGKLEDLLALARLEARKKRFEAGQGPPLKEGALAELERLSKARAAWVESDPSLEEAAGPFLRLGGLEGLAAEGGELTELEEMRRKELEERSAERAPRLEKLTAALEEMGFPALTSILARGLAARGRIGAWYEGLVSKALEKLRGDLVPGEASFDAQRYTRGLLWAREADNGGPLAARAKEALARHVSLVVKDLRDPEEVIRERASDEVYLLGGRGREALEKAGGDPFLLGLLRWRIRPRAYARTGIDFEDYPRLSFREKRRKIFDYARAAEADAIPTLRVIVTDDELEPSFFVKLAAAKALSGLRDRSGFEFLIRTHPDLTLKKPEVSREILIIQAYEHIGDKEYQRAVEVLQRILDEFPFDFPANYHIAFAYLLLKDYAKSIHHFEIARRINPQDQLTLYNLACAYALAGGKTKEALEALEASVKAGFDDYKHVEKDPDLTSLRDEPRYRQLIDRMKSPKN